MKEYKCKKCGGTISQYYEGYMIGAVRETRKKENYLCLNCWEIYKNVRIEEIADMKEVQECLD